MPSRRSAINMTDDEIAAYLADQTVLNVATIGPTGHPHVVAMWYVMLDGAPTFWTFGKSQKVINIRRDPKITGLVESGDSYDQLRGVELVGTARLIEDYDAIRDIGIRVSDQVQRPAERRGAAVHREAGPEAHRCRDRRRHRRQLGPHQARRLVLGTFTVPTPFRNNRETHPPYCPASQDVNKGRRWMRRRAAFGALAAMTLIVAACGGDDDDDAAPATTAGASSDTTAAAETTEAAAATTDGATETTAGGADETTAGTAGDTAAGGAEIAPCATPPEDLDGIKVGIVHSLSGTMSISEVAVSDAELLAIKEINEAGGVLGKQIEAVVEDGASDWPTFAEKAEKLLTVDEVAAVFGGWTSASRKAMLPVFEGLDGLLFYPVQYEGLEASPNIFYTGATTNQQIIPALDYIKEQGMTNVYLVGSDYVFPRTANKIIKAYAEANGLKIVGEDYLPLGDTERRDDRVEGARRQAGHRVQHPERRQQRGVLQGAQGQGQHARPDPDGLGVGGRGGGRRHRRREHRGSPDGLELLPDHRHAAERGVRRGVQGRVRRRTA